MTQPHPTDRARAARRHRVAAIAVCAPAAALGLLAGCSGGSDAKPAATTTTTPGQAPLSKRSLTTVATGTAQGVPDNIAAQLTITTGGGSAAAVMTDNNTRMRKLLDTLKIAGIADKDVATTSINLGPLYDKKGKITGYAATNSVVVTMRDLATAPKQLDLVVSTVGNNGRIDWVRLGFNDQDALLSKARADAITRAHDQAATEAKAAGATLGRVRTIAEVQPQGFDTVGSGRLTPYAADATSVPISAGSQELSVQVKVIFDLG